MPLSRAKETTLMSRKSLQGLVAGTVLLYRKDGVIPTSSAQLSGVWVLPHHLLPPESLCSMPAPTLPLAHWHRHWHCQACPWNRHKKKLCKAAEQAVASWPFQMPAVSLCCHSTQVIHTHVPTAVSGICDVLYPNSTCCRGQRWLEGQTWVSVNHTAN